MMEEKMKSFEVNGWIHPKNGGDDKQFILELDSISEECAKEAVVGWLKNKSDVLDDFVMKVVE
jgi:ribosomal protein L20A (L18A)